MALDLSGFDNVLEEDVYNGEMGHAHKHNQVNDQVNFLTEQLRPIHSTTLTSDGTADQTERLNAALAAGSAFGVSHRVTLIGDFDVTDTIDLPSNIILDGRAAKVSLVGPDNVDVIQARGQSNVSVIGLEVDGVKSYKLEDVSTGRGIHFYGVQGGLIADCYVHDTYEHGIRLGGEAEQDTETNNIVVTGNRLEGCGNAETDRGYGIWAFWRVVDFVISNNVITGCHAGGIAVDDASSDASPNKECYRVTITGNVVRDSVSSLARGIFVEGSRAFTVSGNVIDGSTHYDGILVNDGQGGADTGQGTVTGNRVTAFAFGIRVVDSRDVSVTDNSVDLVGSTLTTQAAIKLEKGPEGATLRRILVAGNLVRSDGPGISSRMATATPGAEDITIQGNTLSCSDTAPGSSSVGINLYDVSNARLIDNVVDAFHTGIYVTNTCTTPAISGNDVRDCTNYGIRIGPAASQVTHNVTARSGVSGMTFDSSARVSSTKVWHNISISETALSGTVTDIDFNFNNFKHLRGVGATLTNADLAISAGWGATALVTNTYGSDQGASFTVTAQGLGYTANPTITLTFKDPWVAAPVVVVSRRTRTAQPSANFSWTVTSNTLTITFEGTPAGGETYDLAFVVMGRP